jgi:hypothetical protein
VKNYNEDTPMKLMLTAVLFVLATSLSAVTFADDHSTLRVVAVNATDANAYIAELRKGKEMMMKIDSKMSMRAWRATFAGTTTGTVIVALEYPGSLSDFAGAWEKTLADKGMASWLDGLSGLRAIVSDSLYQEIPL